MEHTPGRRAIPRGLTSSTGAGPGPAAPTSKHLSRPHGTGTRRPRRRIAGDLRGAGRNSTPRQRTRAGPQPLARSRRPRGSPRRLPRRAAAARPGTRFASPTNPRPSNGRPRRPPAGKPRRRRVSFYLIDASWFPRPLPRRGLRPSGRFGRPRRSWPFLPGRRRERKKDADPTRATTAAASRRVPRRGSRRARGRSQ